MDKGLELAKLARRDRQEFDCATWLHKARQMPKEQSKQVIEKELTGRETEPWEIIYFKLYKSQIPVIEQAIETAALMLGTDKPCRYCLEMICADFLAGAKQVLRRDSWRCQKCGTISNLEVHLKKLRNQSGDDSEQTPDYNLSHKSFSTPNSRIVNLVLRENPGLETVAQSELHDARLVQGLVVFWEKSASP